ncbi:MAG: chromate transporter [Clostridia bacterium]|nr:chromate transporter [Clostridia bacterium]
MIFWELFLTFLKIGAVSFGGGYGMISLIREEVISHGWLTEESFLNMVAVAESTPGPLAVNMATFVGSTQGGFVGSLVATVGVVLPSFAVILVISILLKNILKYRAVEATLSGIRPAVIGLILGTSVTLFLSSFFSVSVFGDSVAVDIPALIIFALLCLISPLYQRISKRKLSPIVLIILSAILGMIFYSVA